jgi:hypothetical protein
MSVQLQKCHLQELFALAIGQLITPVQSLPVCLCSCNMSDRFAKHDCRISHGSTFGLEVQLELSARLSGDRVHFRAMSDEACARQGRIAFV